MNMWASKENKAKQHNRITYNLACVFLLLVLPAFAPVNKAGRIKAPVLFHTCADTMYHLLYAECMLEGRSLVVITPSEVGPEQANMCYALYMEDTLANTIPRIFMGKELYTNTCLTDIRKARPHSAQYLEIEDTAYTILCFEVGRPLGSTEYEYLVEKKKDATTTLSCHSSYEYLLKEKKVPGFLGGE